MRILVGLAIGAVLLVIGIGVGASADKWAADQALLVATTKGYVAPTSSLPAIATSVITLAGAWSAGIVAVLLSEK